MWCVCKQQPRAQHYGVRKERHRYTTQQNSAAVLHTHQVTSSIMSFNPQHMPPLQLSVIVTLVLWLHFLARPLRAQLLHFNRSLISITSTAP